MTTIKELSKEYPHTPPRMPIQLWLLGGLTALGLLALFFAANHAFNLVMQNQAQAFFASVLIEAAMVVEAIALIKRPRSLAPWVGMVASFVVSGTYNYTQVATVAPDMGTWQLLTLAFGPLSALIFVALSFGGELRQWQEAAAIFDTERAEWAEKEYKRREKNTRKVAGKLPETPQTTGKLPETMPETDRKPQNLPAWLPEQPKTMRQFKEMVEDGGVTLPPDITGDDLAKYIDAVGTGRTGRNWLAAVARNGKG